MIPHFLLKPVVLKPVVLKPVVFIFDRLKKTIGMDQPTTMVFTEEKTEI